MSADEQGPPSSPCPTAQSFSADRIRLAGPVARGAVADQEHVTYITTNGVAVPGASPAQAARWINQRRS